MFTLNCKGRILVLDKPVVMGIMNITPDSFYTASRVNDQKSFLQMAEKMIADGASIIDIGGQSTRPGTTSISVDEELSRVIPFVSDLNKYFPSLIISIDTFYSRVAQEALDSGASIVNDISAGMIDKDMIDTVGKSGAPYICMHMKGTPENMQHQAHYENIILEILDYFIQKINTCRLAGIKDIILDPGFGFAKTISHNFELLRNLKMFEMLDRPVLAGLSRKSTVYKTLGISTEEALNGTTVLNTLALANGANILRVHDVKEAREAIELYLEYLG